MMRTMKFSRTAGVATVLACLAASSAFAQPQDGGRRGGGRGFGGGGFGMFAPSVMTVVGNEDVQKDVGFSEEQVAKIKTLQEEYGKAVQAALPAGGNEGGPGAERPSREEREKRRVEGQAAIAKVVDEYRPKLAEIATPEQVKRLDQIVLQAKGVNALTEEAVAKSLDLSAEQTTKIAEVTREYREKQSELFAPGAQGDREERMEKGRELNKAREEALIGVLTQEQKDKLAELKGKEFDVAKLRPSFGRGPGAGRPGSPRQQRPTGDAN